EPQTAPLSDVLGGEKRIEGARQDVRRHSRSRIADGKENVGASLESHDASAFVFKLPVRRLDDDLAAMRHGVAGIVHDVEKSRLESVGIDMDQAGMRILAQMEFDRRIRGP